MLFKKFFVVVVTSGLIYANVGLSYPGTFTQDTSVPGIPSTNIDEYKLELKDWSNQYKSFYNNSILSDADINTYITQTLFERNNPLGEQLTVRDIGDPLTGPGSLVPYVEFSQYPISDAMRDIIFLEEFQNKILLWKNQYINVLGQTNTTFSDIYTQANNIYDRYTDYSGQSGFIQSLHNPLLNVLFGTGNTSYGNLVINDGVIESFTESMITDFLTTSFNQTSFNARLSNVEVTLKDPQTWAKLGVNVGYHLSANILQENGTISGGSKLVLDNIFTATTSLISKGTGLIFCPCRFILQQYVIPYESI